jgi:hypothetical protein
MQLGVYQSKEWRLATSEEWLVRQAESLVLKPDAGLTHHHEAKSPREWMCRAASNERQWFGTRDVSLDDLTTT